MQNEIQQKVNCSENFVNTKHSLNNTINNKHVLSKLNSNQDHKLINYDTYFPENDINNYAADYFIEEKKELKPFSEIDKLLSVNNQYNYLSNYTFRKNTPSLVKKENIENNQECKTNSIKEISPINITFPDKNYSPNNIIYQKAIKKNSQDFDIGYQSNIRLQENNKTKGSDNYDFFREKELLQKSIETKQNIKIKSKSKLSPTGHNTTISNITTIPSKI